MKNKNRNIYRSNECIGLIPAAGYAKRISPIPCSKEIYPVGFYPPGPDGISKPRVISSYLLESLSMAGIPKVYMVIREGKWDIPAYYKNQNLFDLDIAYLVTQPTPSTCHTIDVAYSFLKNKMVAFGFPDIFFRPSDAFKNMREKQKRAEAEVVLGLFKANNPKKMDMVELTEAGTVYDIQIKPKSTNLEYTWIAALWNPVFSDFLHDYVQNNLQHSHGELYLGHVFKEALDKGLRVESVQFSDGYCIDIGTPQDLKRMINISMKESRELE